MVLCRRRSTVTVLRPVLAALLLAVLAVGGVVLPGVHRATHALEAAEDRTAHAETHHTEAGDLAGVPCPPPVHDVDCAVCTSLWTADGPDGPDGRLRAEAAERKATRADWVRAITTTGTGARGPPIG